MSLEGTGRLASDGVAPPRLARILFSALLGALVMFVWSAISHTALIRGIGFTSLPNEEAISDELRQSIKADGLYFFPGIDWSAEPTAEAQAAWQSRFRNGNGILVYHATSSDPVSWRKLVVQFLCDLLASLLAVTLVSSLPVPYWRRVLAVGLLGAFGCVGVSALYWNWYGFTDAFFAAHCFDKIVGWLLAGLAIAKVVSARSPQVPPRTAGRLSPAS